MSNIQFEKFHYQSLEELDAKFDELGWNIPIQQNFGNLSSPVQISGKTIPNRIAYQPMEGCDGTPSGSPDELTIRRYLRFAKGGPGIIWFEAVAIEQEGRANPRQLFLREDNLEDFRSLVSQIKKTCLEENGYEPIVIMQATHSGRYSKPNGFPEPIIAYNNPIFEGDSPIPKDRIITDEKLRELEKKMAVTAQLAERAGFDGVDVKCCHRYLNCELLSAYTREGDYGGSFENRTRFLRNCIHNIQAVVSPDFIVTTRLNVYDGFEYPYSFGEDRSSKMRPDMTEPLQLLGLLQSDGIELIDITMGNPYVNPHVNRPYDGGPYVPNEHPLNGVGRMLHYTGELQQHYPDMKIICSGLSYLREFTPYVAAGLIEDNMTTFAGVGRMTFAYPDFARDVCIRKTVDKGQVCIACGGCSKIMRAGSTPGCIIRDKELYMPLYQKYVINKG